MLRIVHDADGSTTVPTLDLDELCRLAAREMLGLALEAERRAYLDAHAGELDATGRRLVVGNGYARERAVMTGAGMVEAAAPRVDDRRPDERFRSALLPPYARRSPKVTEVLPILYLRGLSSGDFAPALASFFGSDAGLSASTISRGTGPDEGNEMRGVDPAPAGLGRIDELEGHRQAGRPVHRRSATGKECAAAPGRAHLHRGVRRRLTRAHPQLLTISRQSIESPKPASSIVQCRHPGDCRQAVAADHVRPVPDRDSGPRRESAG